MSYAKTVSLFEDYSDRIVYGSETEDEALQNAVDWAFRDRTDEFRADLYSRIKEAWDRVEIEARFITTQWVLDQLKAEGKL